MRLVDAEAKALGRAADGRSPEAHHPPPDGSDLGLELPPASSDVRGRLLRPCPPSRLSLPKGSPRAAPPDPLQLPRRGAPICLPVALNF